MSHCLQRAGIDHVVLERRNTIVRPNGASINLWPQGLRLMEQLGCFSGTPTVVSPLFRQIIERHGYGFLVIDREKLMRIIYDHLPSQSYVRGGCSVVHIDEDKTGVKVHLEDGSVEVGDIVVGADGVNSVVRRAMWTIANDRSPGTFSEKEQQTLNTTYKCLFGTCTPPARSVSGEMTQTHNDRFSFLTLTQPTRVYFFVFIKLPKARRWPDRPKYNSHDAELEASKYMACRINEKLTFGDLWSNKLWFYLTPLEEGVFKQWHWGRIALVGDSAHKMTPNLAFGANSAMESVAALSNGLNRALKNQSDSTLSREQISMVFQDYQEKRMGRVTKVHDFTGGFTRVSAWDGLLNKFMALWVLPIASHEFVGDKFSRLIRGGVKLDYVPYKESRSGSVHWDDESRENAGGKGKLTSVTLVSVLVVCLGLGALIRWLFWIFMS
ncbi:FAD/NAD(P)-binding domain-containing protein [Mytilinidion resinicola]|uniref:FAD/NAD(P)-binding domain-containing protein n=1 Tax=Mytilinidion resinicola TaxID=574789 RepID=A0A6A6YR06_9PEZI|nr:FAD/NAD(P)-binding domain-containing protein [Mytilinidion resinicola]KAF2810454.1 FAD/NAD(P)-binding domain-containing protein [Mytilinidion resinicola]